MPREQSIIIFLLFFLIITSCTPATKTTPKSRSGLLLLSKNDSFKKELPIVSSSDPLIYKPSDDWVVVKNNSTSENDSNNHPNNNNHFCESYDGSIDWEVQRTLLSDSSANAIEQDSKRIVAHAELINLYGSEHCLYPFSKEELLGYKVEEDNELEALHIDIFPVATPTNALISATHYKQSMLKVASIIDSRVNGYIQSMLDVICAYYVPLIRQQIIPTQVHEKIVIEKCSTLFNANCEAYKAIVSNPIWDHLFNNLIACIESIGMRQRFYKTRRFFQFFSCNCPQTYEVLINMLVDAKSELLGPFFLRFYLTLGVRLFNNEKAHLWLDTLYESCKFSNGNSVYQNDMLTMINVGLAELMFRYSEHLLKARDESTLDIVSHLKDWMRSIDGTVDPSEFLVKIKKHLRYVPKLMIE